MSPEALHDIALAWLTLLLGLTGVGAAYAMVAKFIRSATGGLG